MNQPGPSQADAAAVAGRSLSAHGASRIPVAAASIEATLRWLVALCALPVVGSVAILLCTAPRVIEALGMTALGATVRAFGWWLGLASVVSIFWALVLAQIFTRRIMTSIRRLSEDAAKLAEVQALEMQSTHIKEGMEAAGALVRVTTLLRERTAERDGAAAAATHLRLAGQELQHQASHDGLTGLMNRRRFDTVIGERVAACDRGGDQLTLLFIDVDGFKRFNDRYGHAVGDDLLRLFAARIRSNVREAEVVARLGGDEFAVVLSHATPSRTLETADRLIDQLSRPYQVGALTLEVSASIGLAAYPGSGTCAKTLLQAADAAMYLAKDAGKCRHVTSGFGLL
jgi:diguanylate cyclase (GGDEF)-like protein